LHDFYVLAGTAAATLVGLLFVGLSLHLRIVITVPEVRSLAGVTLANFGAVLFVSLFMVINQGHTTAALELIGAGVLTLFLTAPSLITIARGQNLTWEMQRGERVRLVLRFGLSGVSYIAIIAAGVFLLLSLTSAFVWVIVVAIVVLLLISLRNTWDLLVTVGEVTLESEPDNS
jgi:hypothetical protein